MYKNKKKRTFFFFFLFFVLFCFFLFCFFFLNMQVCDALCRCLNSQIWMREPYIKLVAMMFFFFRGDVSDRLFALTKG